MKFSTMTTTVLGLLCCCLAVNANPTPFYQQVTGDQFISLNSAVLTRLEALLKAELIAVNNTVNALKPLVSTCLTSIEDEQTACGQCINTTCQARVDALQCTVVQPLPESSSSSCSPKAICDIKNMVTKAEAGIVVISNAIENLAKNAISAIKKVSEQVISSIGDGLKTAGNSIKNVAEKTVAGAKNTAEKIAAGVENVAKEVGKTIVDGIEEAGKAVGNVVEDGVNAIKDGADKVKDFFGSIGRKRRQATEPVCDDFATDETACLFYQGQCQSCAAFGTGGTEPSAEDLILGVCGQSHLNNYINLDAALDRIDNIIEVAQNFTLLEVKFNPTVWKDGGYSDVQSLYNMNIANKTLPASKPINPYVSDVAGKLIAEDVFSLELPVAA